MGGDKRVLTAEKSRLIHRSLQGDLLRRVADILPVNYVFIFLVWREDSVGKPVPADPGAPVAAVRTDDDDGDKRQSHSNDK